MTWTDQAACHDIELDRFFIPSPTRARDMDLVTHTARTLCRACPVITACAAHADLHLEIGLWAGAYRRRIGATYARTFLITEAPGQEGVA